MGYSKELKNSILKNVVKAEAGFSEFNRIFSLLNCEPLSLVLMWREAVELLLCEGRFP